MSIASTMLAVCGAVLVAGCAKQQVAAPPPAASSTMTLPLGLRPAASIIDLMHDPLETQSNAVWEASGTLATAAEAGAAKKAEADAQWLALRPKALAMMEAANLLVVEGRPVAHPGQKLRTPSDPTSFSPEQSQAAIEKDRAGFTAFALVLQNTVGQMLAAIDKRDLDAYDEAGNALTDACAGCHKRFWYPQAPTAP